MVDELEVYQTGRCKGAIDVKEADCILNGALVKRRIGFLGLCHCEGYYLVCVKIVY